MSKRPKRRKYKDNPYTLNEITKIKKKIKYSNVIFNKGLKSYIYCYKYKIGIIIHNDELFTTIKNQTPFEIINNKIKSK